MSLTSYQPRRVEPLSLWRPEGLVIKPYSIVVDGAPAPSDALVGTARMVAQEALPETAAHDTGHHGLGFAILHEGQQGIWLLLHWWAFYDICCQSLYRAEPGSRDFVNQDQRKLMACVWELKVIDHERQAWINTMLTDNPLPEAYLADQLSAGLY